jgi:hypothetical protein
MVRIGIGASERIGLACEAEAVAGPAVMSVPPQCRQRPLNAGQILAATVRYWPTAAVRIVVSNSTGPVDRDRQFQQQDYTLSNVLTCYASLRKGLPSSFTKSGVAKSQGPGFHGKQPKRRYGVLPRGSTR